MPTAHLVTQIRYLVSSLTSLSSFLLHILPSIRKLSWSYPVNVSWIFLLLFISPTPPSSGYILSILDYSGELLHNFDASIFPLAISFHLASRVIFLTCRSDNTPFCCHVCLNVAWLLVVLRIKLWNSYKILRLPLQSHLYHYPTSHNCLFYAPTILNPFHFLYRAVLSLISRILHVLFLSLCSVSSSAG